MLKYRVEFETEETGYKSRDFDQNIESAKSFARRTSKRLDDIVYIVATDEATNMGRVKFEDVGHIPFYRGSQLRTEGRVK